MSFKYNPLFPDFSPTSGSGGGGGGTTPFQESLGTGDGIEDTFGPLTNAPVSADAVIVFIDGLMEDKANWSLSTLDIVFTVPPAAAQNIYVYYTY